MQRYEKATLTKAALVMEECYFVDSVLNDCDLFYSGGDVEMINTRLDNCRFHWRGPAQKTVQTLMQFGMLKVAPLPVSSQVNTSKAN